jgi:NAD(P)-dependent dehydrogenase (short-subunit alcohol dehydrogenase family)
MNENPASGLVNCFALNDHADLLGKDRKTSVELGEFSLDSFSRYFHINVTSLFGVCRAFLSRNPAGSIVNFSSVYARVTPRSFGNSTRLKHPAYGLSKVAVEHLSRYLAVNGPSKARVNYVRLGGVLRNHSKDFVNKYSVHTSLGRMASTKDHLPLVAFLLGENSKYITGAVISVDSGWTA